MNSDARCNIIVLYANRRISNNKNLVLFVRQVVACEELILLIFSFIYRFP